MKKRKRTKKKEFEFECAHEQNFASAVIFDNRRGDVYLIFDCPDCGDRTYIIGESFKNEEQCKR